MTVRITVKVPDLTALGDKIKAAVTEGTRRSAQRLPEATTDQLRVGRKPDGSNQPPNDFRYLERKVAEGKSFVSGVRDGVLSDHLRWTVEQLADEAFPSWRVRPPAEREQIVKWLGDRQKRWEFVGVPDRWREDLRAELQAELRKLEG